ncbi:MAG: DUF2182 domain-containing protein [Silicimonas sp.]|nr:DUF2182 domain-containing protein [Silicimonas sp.]
MGQGHWLALFAGLLGLWALLFIMAVPSGLVALDALAALCRVTPDAAGYGSAVAMWGLMGAAMMTPTALPAFATYDDLPGTTGAGLMRLVGGYLAVWGSFALAAAALQTGLHATGMIGQYGESRSAWLTAALLAIAGLYQFSPLKEACLSRCRAPLAFFMGRWSEGAFRNGLRLGLDCLGCCWALMLLAFVGGTMNLAFMGLAMLLMAVEKLPTAGTHVSRPLGYGLLGLAILSPVTLLI